MRNSRKTEGELLQELRLLRQRIAELEQGNCKPGGNTVRSSEAQFREIFENTQVGVYRTTPDGRILMANPALVRMLGYSSFEELAQRNLEEKGYEPQYSRVAFKDRIEKEGQVVGLESAWMRQDGATLIVIENARAVRDEHGNTLYYEGTAENITERKKAEMALQESEERLAAFMDSAPCSFASFDTELNLTDINARGLTLLGPGTKKDEVIGKNMRDLYPGFEKSGRHKKYLEVIRTGKPLHVDGALPHPEFGGIYFSVVAFRTVGGLGLIIVDITEQKKTEEKLRQSEERLRAMMDASTESVLLADDQMNILAINRTAAQRFGRSVEELIGCNDEDLSKGVVPPAVVRSRRAKVRQVIRSGRPVRFEDERDGIIFDTSMYPVFNSEGHVSQVAVFGRDITAQKKAEEKLQQSEERLRTLMDSSTDSVLLVDSDLKILAANRTVVQKLGISEEELIGRGPDELGVSPFPRAVLKSRAQKARQVIRSGKPARFEDELAGRFFDTNIFPIFDSPGQVHQLAVFARDITEQKKAEERLRQSEERLRAMMNATTESVLLIDKDMRILSINKIGAQRLGKSVEELVGSSFYDMGEGVVPRPVLELRAQKLREVIRSGKALRMEDERAGIAMDSSLYPLFDSEGQAHQVVVFASDITERKLAEQALRQSEQKYRTLVENLPQRVFLKDRNSIYVSCNENYARDLGISPELLPGKSDYDFYAAELAEKYRADDKRIMESGEIQDIEEMYIRGGKEMIVHTVKTPVRDQEGNVTGVLGIFWDITEQKRLERALLESEERYRTLVENAGESIVTLDRDGLHLFMNKTGAERFGGKPEDFIGKTIWDVFPRDVAESRLAIMRMVIDTGQGINQTEKVQIHGQERWYNATIEPLRDSDGKIIAVMIIARDIHEARMAEMELEAYREKMAAAERLASMGTLSATLAHELTQPLTVITLSIEDSLAELGKTSCPQTVTEGLQDGLSEVSNVTAIIERFRNFARKSSEKTIDRVELGVVAKRIAKLLNKSAQQAGIKLHLGRLDKLPAVYLNEKDLEQLFFALVQNAVQAAGGKEGRELVIDGAVKRGRIELRFSDNCGGIQPENLDKLFEPFFTTKPAGEGTGLGLCIVQRVAERSGGGVRVENRPGEGATFIVTLGIDRNRM